MTNESETIKKHPDFNEWLKTKDGLSCNDISNLAEQKYLTNRLFWAFDAGRNCVWSQYLVLQKECLHLAAHQCQFPGSGDGGDAYCAKIKEQEKIIKYLLSIVKMAKETGELWLNDQDWNKIESLNTKEK